MKDIDLDLSIIVPVYNVELYLQKCLESLFEQDIDSSVYEILIINDGSTDNSLSIAEEFAESKQNVHIFNQSNSGLGASRNVGIRNAQGDYLLFVDSDDYLEPNRLGTLLREAKEKNLDLLRFGYQSVDENYQIISKTQSATFAVNMSNTVVDGKDFLAERLGWACYVPMFLFRKSLIEKEPILFSEGVYYEDADWLPRVMVQATKASSIDLVVYYYLRRTGSITLPTSQAKRQKLVTDRMLLINKILQLGQYVKHKGVEQWTKGIIALSVIRILTLVGSSVASRQYQAETIEELKKLGVFPLAAHNFNRKQRLNVLCINISPWLFTFIKSGRNRRASKK